MIFAVRLDTFPMERETKVFYIGTNSPAELTKIRRHILAHSGDLPLEGEYLHRVAFDIAEKYGKDTFLAIRYLGTGWLPTFFSFKGRFEAIAGQIHFLPQYLSDKVLQAISQIFPKHLPKRMREYRDRYEHHLMLKMAGTAISEARSLLQSTFPSVSTATSSNARLTRARRLSCTALPPPVLRSATARFTTVMSKTSSRSTSR